MLMDHNTDSALQFVHSARPALAHDDVAELLAARWGISGELVDAGGDRDQNLFVTAAEGPSFFVKVGQPGEDPGVLDMQLAALRHVAQHDPGIGVPEVISTADGDPMYALPADGGGEHRLRVFRFVPGRPVSRHERTPALMRDVGARLARLDRALRGFFHPHALHRLLWDVREAPAIRACAFDIPDAGMRDRVLGILDDFSADVLPRLAGLRSQVIHGDVTADNTLAAGDPPAVTGFIDFGDVVQAPLVQELAVAMADTPYGLDAPWEAACQVAAGFDERLPLEDEELSLLWDLALARVALTAAVLASRAAGRAEGTGSMAGIVGECRRQLEAFDAVGRAGAFAALRRTLRLPEPVAAGPCGASAQPTEALRRQRDERLMPGLALFYPEAPLHAVRGEGVWMIDAGGGRHLDCYNNVPHVGHCHPHVVNAVARQTAALNTNTRYLYDSVTEYAERLAGKMPGELGVALFVNSGSEANDLAWRMAAAYTGRRGALVTAGAYHGCTAATAALSPSDAPEGDIPEHVRMVVPPAGLTGRPRGGEPAAAAIAALDAGGFGTAAVMVDSTFASDGILDAPEGYMADLFAQVRDAGGLCIADEVQAGFGRLGKFWGFEAHGVVPDIVTLGKPAGNGYPLAAVVTTPEVMAAFAQRRDYFSTFGGNPVACTAGLAVLDVIEREDLCRRAATVGSYLRQRLAELGRRHAAIADVRGSGLFLGVELSRPRDDGAPATEETAAVALALRRDGVLVGIEGPGANVLKIRPPLVFREEHADRFVAALDRAVAAAM